MDRRSQGIIAWLSKRIIAANPANHSHSILSSRGAVIPNDRRSVLSEHCLVSVPSRNRTNPRTGPRLLMQESENILPGIIFHAA